MISMTGRRIHKFKMLGLVALLITNLWFTISNFVATYLANLIVYRTMMSGQHELACIYTVIGVAPLNLYAALSAIIVLSMLFDIVSGRTELVPDSCDARRPIDSFKQGLKLGTIFGGPLAVGLLVMAWIYGAFWRWYSPFIVSAAVNFVYVPGALFLADFKLVKRDEYEEELSKWRQKCAKQQLGSE